MTATVTRSQRVLLAIVAATVVAAAATRPVGGVVAFACSLVALASVAWLVSFATEAIAEHAGPALVGSLQSTLGNLPELMVALFAINAGEVQIALASLVGSILANGLLVLGFVIVAGTRAAPDGVMRFSARLPNDTATLLGVAVFAIVLVGLASSSHDRAAGHVTTISVVTSVCLIAVYLAWVVPYLRSDRGAAIVRERPPRFSLRASLVLVVGAAALAALVADWFVASLRPALTTLGVSKAFAGFVIVALAGNAAEHTSGVVLAAKGQADVAIAVVKNSVSQIAAFVFPVAVLASLAFPSHLTYAMAPVYIGALALATLAIWQITGDGRGLLFEGVALVALFVILATFAWFQ